MLTEKLINSHRPDRHLSQCPFCGKSFKSVNIHVSKAHPTVHRDRIHSQLLPVITSGSNQSEEVSDSSFNIVHNIISNMQILSHRNWLSGFQCFQIIWIYMNMTQILKNFYYWHHTGWTLSGLYYTNLWLWLGGRNAENHIIMISWR